MNYKDKQITLGKLIDLIENSDCYINLDEYIKKYNSEPNVIFDFGSAYPTGASSWRGIYSELALNYSLSGYDKDDGKFNEITVSKFLKILKDCINKEFTGWKGGEFRMNKNTPIWVANNGNSGNTGVVGIIDKEYCIVIETRYIQS